MSKLYKFFFLFFALLLLTLSTIFFFAKEKWIVEGDGLGYYAHLRSFVIDGDLDYLNEFRDFNPRNHTTQIDRIIPKTGRVANKYPIGPALLWSPFFLIGHGISHLSALPNNGYNPIYQYSVQLSSIFYGFLGVWFIFKTILLFYSHRIAFSAAVGFCLASNSIFYIAIHPTMAHTTSMFAVSGFVYYNLRHWRSSQNWKDYIGIGVFGGLILLTRYQNAIFFLIPLYPFITAMRKPAVSREKIAVLTGYVSAGVITLFLILLQLLVWKETYGAYLLYSYGDESFSNWATPKLWSTLFSAQCGYILWHPVTVLGLVGLYNFAKKEKTIGVLLSCLFVIQWYIFSSWYMWDLGNSFGYRGFMNLSVIVSLGLAAIMYRGPFKMIAILLSVLVFWNFLLMLQYAIGWIPHDGPINFLAVMKNQYRIIGHILKLLFGG